MLTIATFANDEDIDRNRASTQPVSIILDDSDCEDTVPGNVDDRISAELSPYRSSKTEPIQTDPLQFWKNEDTTYRNVVMQSQKLLCVPAASAPCERIFSVAREILSADHRPRSALRPDNVIMLLHVFAELAPVGPYSVV